MTNRLGRRAALALPMGLAGTLAAPAIPRAQSAVEITIHYAQPFIFKASYDALIAAFARIEPNIRINTVTTPNYAEGAQLLLRQAATNQLPDLSYQGLNLMRVFAERQIAQDVMPFLRREGDPASLGYTDALLALARMEGFQEVARFVATAFRLR